MTRYVWETKADMNGLYATGDTTSEALLRLAGAIAARDCDHHIIDLQFLLEDEGVTVGVLMERP